MTKPFTIFRVSWATQQLGNENGRDYTIQHVYYLIKFLQENALVVRPLMLDIEDISEDFALSSDDLTDDGLALMKKSYDKWLGKVDKGMSPEDVSFLSKSLSKIRDNKN